MAVDYTGMFILLAGRRYLGVKILDDSSDLLHKFPRQSKYEVGVAEWNPSAINKDKCAITSNQRVELMSWQSGAELVLTHSLRSHTRVVSDLSWHRFDPNLLASCSIDTFVYIWDIRDQRRPAVSLSAVAGATQVRWNRISSHLLATAHDGDIKLWDQRKGTSPVQYIAAHLSKIHGLDWSPIQENQLATSSQDCTVKFFDVTNPRRAEMVLTLTSPVWRARYTPFGTGMVTVVVPQLRRGENGLLLWNISNQSAPVHTFVGHTDVVLEFEWRRARDDLSNYQLITWSKDQSLRIWKIDPVLIKLCGNDKEDDDSKDIEDQVGSLSSTSKLVMEPTLTHPLQTVPIENGSDVSELLNSMSIIDECSENGSGISTEKEINPSPTQPKTLQQEFSLININIPNLIIDSMDAVKRCCTVSASRNSHLVVLSVNFPPNYPFNAVPSFQFGPGTSIDSIAMAKILKALKHTAQQRVRKRKSCLEPCLRQLVTTLEQSVASDEPESKPYYRYQNQTSFLEPSNVYGGYQDTYIPFPRTSGAKFCSMGILVCFGRPQLIRRLSRLESLTPRSLSALGNHGSFGLSNSANTSSSQYSLMYPPVAQSPTGDPSMSITSFYFQDRVTQKQTMRSRARGFSTSRSLSTSKTQIKKNASKAVVTVYDVSSLFFANRELGEKYVFNSDDVPSMCQQNSVIAATVGRKDLVQIWTIAALAASSTQASEQDDDAPWPHHPFGRAMIEMLIAHYAKQSDIQMAAMLCCAFCSRLENQDLLRQKQLSKSVNVSRLATGKWWLKPGGSPYHTIHQVDLSLEGWSYPTLKQNRSNSWSDSLDDFKVTTNIVEHKDFSEVENGKYIRMLDEKNTNLYDSYKRAYADILYRWNLLDAHAQVLKYLSTPPEPHRGVEFISECRYCSKQMPSPNCCICKKLILQCAICHISVRGSSNYCLVCGHGGHTNHMLVWFETETVCPTGCGCKCLVESSNVLEQ